MQDLGTDGSSASTSHECHLPLECETQLGSVFETLQVDTGKLLAILPAMLLLSLKMQERDGFCLAALDITIHGYTSDRSITAWLLHVTVLLRHDLMLVHSQSTNDFLVQGVELQLGAFRKLVLFANQLVNTA